MKKILAIMVTASLFLGIVFFSTGCAMAAQRAVERAIERELDREGITIDEDEETVTVKKEDEAGRTEMTWGSDDLPEGLPGEVPVYPDMAISMTSKETSEGTANFTIMGTSLDSGEKIFEWYKGKLSGWDSFSESTMSTDDGKMYVINAQIGTWDDPYRLNIDIQIWEFEEEENSIWKYVSEYKE